MYNKQLASLCIWLCLMLGAFQTWAAEDFLLPDQAFSISVRDQQDDFVRVVWRIADGYYMYRSKFRFSTDTPGVVLGAAEMPPSETKHDPIFGDVEVYRGAVEVELPVKLAGHAPDMLTLKARRAVPMPDCATRHTPRRSWPACQRPSTAPCPSTRRRLQTCRPRSIRPPVAP